MSLLVVLYGHIHELLLPCLVAYQGGREGSRVKASKEEKFQRVSKENTKCFCIGEFEYKEGRGETKEYTFPMFGLQRREK